jgi:hypothetical protein
MTAPRAGDAPASPRFTFARILLLVALGAAAAFGPLVAAHWVRWDALHYSFHVETCVAVTLLGAIGLAKRRPRVLAMMLVALLPTVVGVSDAIGQLRLHAQALAISAGRTPAADIADFIDRVPRAWGSLAWGEGTGGLAILLVAFCAALHVGRAVRPSPLSALVALLLLAGLASWRVRLHAALSAADAGFLLAFGVALAGFVTFAAPSPPRASIEDEEARARLALFGAFTVGLGVLLLDHGALCWARRELVDRLGSAGPAPSELIALQTEIDHRRGSWLLEPLAVVAGLVSLVITRAPGGVTRVRRAGGASLAAGLGVGLVVCVALLGGERLLDRDLAALHAPLAVLDTPADLALPPGQTGAAPEPSGTVVLVDARGDVQIARRDRGGPSAESASVTLLADARAPFAPVSDLLERAPSPGGDLEIVTRREGDPPWPAGSFAALLDFGLTASPVAFETPDATVQRLTHDRGPVPPRRVVLLDDEGARVGLLGWQGTVPVTLGAGDDLRALRDSVAAAIGAFPSRGVDVAAGPGVAWGRVARALFSLAVDGRSSTRLEGVTLVTDRIALERELAEPVPSAAPTDAAPVPRGHVTFFMEDPAVRPDRTRDAPLERQLPSGAVGSMPTPLSALSTTRDWRRKKDPPLLWTSELEASLQSTFTTCYLRALTSAPDLRGEVDAVVSVVAPATLVQVLTGTARHFTQSLPAARDLMDCLGKSPKDAASRAHAPVETWDTFSVTARFEP